MSDMGMKLELALRNAVKDEREFYGEASAFSHWIDNYKVSEKAMTELIEIIKDKPIGDD